MFIEMLLNSISCSDANVQLAAIGAMDLRLFTGKLEKKIKECPDMFNKKYSSDELFVMSMDAIDRTKGNIFHTKSVLLAKVLKPIEGDIQKYVVEEYKLTDKLKQRVFKFNGIEFNCVFGQRHDRISMQKAYAEAFGIKNGLFTATEMTYYRLMRMEDALVGMTEDNWDEMRENLLALLMPAQQFCSETGFKLDSHF